VRYGTKSNVSYGTVLDTWHMVRRHVRYVKEISHERAHTKRTEYGRQSVTTMCFAAPFLRRVTQTERRTTPNLQVRNQILSTKRSYKHVFINRSAGCTARSSKEPFCPPPDSLRFATAPRQPARQFLIIHGGNGGERSHVPPTQHGTQTTYVCKRCK
jgi:hypothetical protein